MFEVVFYPNIGPKKRRTMKFLPSVGELVNLDPAPHHDEARILVQVTSVTHFQDGEKWETLVNCLIKSQG